MLNYPRLNNDYLLSLLQYGIALTHCYCVENKKCRTILFKKEDLDVLCNIIYEYSSIDNISDDKINICKAGIAVLWNIWCGELCKFNKQENILRSCLDLQHLPPSNKDSVSIVTELYSQYFNKFIRLFDRMPVDNTKLQRIIDKLFQKECLEGKTINIMSENEIKKDSSIVIEHKQYEKFSGNGTIVKTDNTGSNIIIRDGLKTYSFQYKQNMNLKDLTKEFKLKIGSNKPVLLIFENQKLDESMNEILLKDLGVQENAILLNNS